jgi:hypothetical protein
LEINVQFVLLALGNMNVAGANYDFNPWHDNLQQYQSNWNIATTSDLTYNSKVGSPWTSNHEKHT